jgi:hypothetical protein
MQKIILSAVLIAFSVQGVYVLSQIGYWEIWRYEFAALAGQQVLADLTIALGLVMTWVWHDAKATGRNVWPWLIFALIAGSFSPLLYLLTRKTNAQRGELT